MSKGTSGVASTVCLPFRINPMTYQDNGTFYTFDSVDESTDPWTVTMVDATNKVSDVQDAGTPLLFMPKQTGEVTFEPHIGSVSDNFTVASSYTAGTTTNGSWTYTGTYETIEWATDPGNIYGFASGQAYGNSGDETAAGTFIRVRTGGIRPFRAYLNYSGGTNNAPARGTRSAAGTLPDVMTVRLVGADGTVTAIGTLDTRTGEAAIGTWHSLGGQQLDGKPTAKGIYIHNGRKVVIK